MTQRIQDLTVSIMLIYKSFPDICHFLEVGVRISVHVHLYWMFWSKCLKVMVKALLGEL